MSSDLRLATATAGELSAELRQCTLEGSLYSICHGLGAVAEKHLNSHLIEPHKRPHTHAAGNEDLDAVCGQMIHRGHAAALLMRNVGQGAHFPHLAFGNYHQGAEIAVTEMGPQQGLEPTGMD